jgi:hypothetical protein
MDWYQTFKDFAGPVATVIASGAAAFVAYRLGQNQMMVAKAQANIAERNWQTENEKVVLELMERRLAIYKNIQQVIGEVIRTSSAKDDVFFRYLQAIDQVPYLFGPDVESYLEAMRIHLIDLEHGNQIMADTTSPDYLEGVEIKHREFKAIVKFYEEAKPIFGPYIRAHQRADAGRLTE